LETKFYFVIGGDILHSLHLWGNADKLVQENAFIVFYRKGYELLPDKMPAESRVVEVDLPEISSSAIKAVVASHGKTREEKLQELKEWVSEEVITLLL
jgi:nicotinate-nucleotide adenylyltransferase